MSLEIIIPLIVGSIVGALTIYFIVSYRNWKTNIKSAPQDLFDRKATEDLLKRSGFKILGIDLKQPVITNIDGKEHYGHVVADYLVKKGKVKYIVIVKKGEAEFDANDPLFRRKLIECCRVFNTPEVLLVDSDDGEIHIVGFRYPHEWNLDLFFRFLLAVFIVLGLIGIIWLLASVGLL